MNTFFTYEDHLELINQCINEQPSKIVITSFGLYGGITYTGDDTKPWGQHYHLHTRDYLDKLNNFTDVDIIIGSAPYKSCKGNLECLHCEKQYCKNLLRIINHAEFFSNIKWKISFDLHIRANLFYFEKGTKCIMSGRNLTDSPWIDFSVLLVDSDCNSIIKQVDDINANSQMITADILPSILETQNISKMGFESLIND